MIKYRPKWCPVCKYYLPPKGASSHKCLNKGEVFIGESKIKCGAYTEKQGIEKVSSCWSVFGSRRRIEDTTVIKLQPDSEGWWWFRSITGGLHCAYVCYDGSYNIRINDMAGYAFWTKCSEVQGTWIKAEVPEFKEE